MSDPEELDRLQRKFDAEHPRIIDGEDIEAFVKLLRYKIANDRKIDTTDALIAAEIIERLRWPCRRLPREQWCDCDGPKDFMGHTCQLPKPITTKPTRIELHHNGVIIIDNEAVINDILVPAGTYQVLRK